MSERALVGRRGRHLPPIMMPISAEDQISNDATPCLTNIPGRLCIGAEEAIIVSAPIDNPEHPSPATARPRMNIFEETATPHSKEPSSKRPKKARNVIF